MASVLLGKNPCAAFSMSQKKLHEDARDRAASYRLLIIKAF